MNGDGIELTLIDEGAGPPVLLLHGFPDSADLWREQIAALTGAGLRAIAPDLRGFGESDKPDAVGDYRIAHSVADIVALLDGLGIERAHVVGHDWGAGLAWAFAGFLPQRVDRLVAMSVGHPVMFSRRTIEQREKSWYMLLFQFEEAEEILRRNDWALFREWASTHPDVDGAIARLERPGALTAGLNWYRASMHPSRELEGPPPLPKVQADTLGMWSTGDRYLVEDGIKNSGEMVEGSWRYERIEGAGHWLQRDAAERVNELLLEFLC